MSDVHERIKEYLGKQEVTEKHLQGRHNQKLHGNRGGASASSGVRENNYDDFSYNQRWPISKINLKKIGDAEKEYDRLAKYMLKKIDNFDTSPSPQNATPKQKREHLEGMRDLYRANRNASSFLNVFQKWTQSKLNKSKDESFHRATIKNIWNELRKSKNNYDRMMYDKLTDILKDSYVSMSISQGDRKVTLLDIE